MPEQYTHTHWIIDEAVKFLGARDPEHPLLLWVVFEAPHSPFDPPAPYDRMYDSFAIPDPVWGNWLDGSETPILRADAADA
jgi:arylsulfatase